VLRPARHPSTTDDVGARMVRCAEPETARAARAWARPASPQENDMQYRNPKKSSSQLSPFDQAFARALRRAGAESPADPDLDLDPEPGAGGDDLPFFSDEPEESTADPLLVDGAQLLRAVREPIEWMLGLARRLAGDDPVDIAAVARVHAAFCARLRGQPARLRSSDLFIVLGLLLGALDPSVVARAVAGTIGDGLAAVLGTESPVEVRITEASDQLARQPPRRLRFLRWGRPLRTRFVL
jgi:hypothetical protein